MKRRTIGALLGVGIILFSFSILGCSGSEKGSAKAETTIKVGTDATYPPFGFKDEATGALTGFDIDIIQAIGKEENLKVEVENLNFDGLLPALESGNINVAISDMTITKERAAQVDFSDPYYKAGTGLVVGIDNNTIHSFKDLEGKRIGVSIGSTGAEVAHTIKDGQVREFNTIVDAFLELKNGGIDVVLNDTPVNQYYIDTKGKNSAKIVGEDYDVQPLGIAVKKGNTELLSKINKGLAKIKENGQYAVIYKKWFGVEPPKENN